MNNKDFDFYISQSACLQALEGYKEMEKRMEDEKDTITQTIEDTKKYWVGNVQRDVEDKMDKFLNQGIFQETYEKLKTVGNCIEESLPTINALLARCEGFAEQLEYDSYVEPYKPVEGDNQEWNGGILTLNYDYVSSITEMCDKILEENRQITSALTSAINNCSGLLDGTDADMERLTLASDKVNRIENYKTTFSAYASGVQELSINMRVCLQSISYGEVDDVNKLSADEKQELAEQFVDYENTEVVMMFAEEIFAKDATEWTEAEIDFIARTWDDAVQNERLDVIEMYSKEMFTEEYLELDRIALDEDVWQCKYRFKCDEQKVDLIMSHLDSKEQGTAYYTLNRFKSIQTDENTIIGTLYEIRTKKTFNISVIPENDSIQIKIKTPVELSTFCAEEKSEISLTLCDMNDVIGVDQERALKELGYDANDIENVRLSIISDTDIEFAKQFYSRDYDSAFKVDPEYMSSKMLESVGKFLLNLEDMKPEDKGTRGRHVEELETIINTLLYADSDPCSEQLAYHNDRYIDLITDILCDLSERAVVELNLGFMIGLSDAELAELALEGREYYNQYSLWESVRHVYNLDIGYEQLELLRSSYREGNMYMRIENLTGGIGSTDDKNGAGCYSFDVYIMNEDFISEYGEDHFLIILNNPTQHGLLNKEIKNRIEELKEERKEIRAKMIAKPISYLPEVGTAAAMLFEAEDVAELISSYGQISQEIEEFYTKYEVNNWGKYTWMKTCYIKDGEKVGNKDIEQCIGYQCAAPEIVYKMNLLKKYGLEVYLENAINKVPDGKNKETYIREVIDTIDQAKENQKITQDLKELISEEPIETIDWVDSIINDNYKENINLLSEWIY